VVPTKRTLAPSVCYRFGVISALPFVQRTWHSYTVHFCCQRNVIMLYVCVSNMTYSYSTWLPTFFVVPFYLQSVPVYSVNCATHVEEGSVALLCN
jgi:hypothetical protein